jgi:hypothetical protein
MPKSKSRRGDQADYPATTAKPAQAPCGTCGGSGLVFSADAASGSLLAPCTDCRPAVTS